MSSGDAPVELGRAARKAVPWGAVIFSIGFAVGLFMVFVAFKAQTLADNKFDPYLFGEMGKKIANGEGFSSFGLLIKRRAPFYPLVIGIIYTVFGEQPMLVQLLQCLLFAGTCALVYDIGRRLFNQRTGIIAALLVALHPMLVRYVADLHLETTLTFLFTLTIWLTVRFYSRPTIAAGALIGGAAALAALTKAVVVLYPALFAAGFVVRAILARRRGEKQVVPWAPLATMFVTMALVISPWTIRNYLTVGHFVPISTGLSDAFLRGHVFSKPEYALLQKPPYVDAELESNEWFREICAREGAEWEKDDWQTDRILSGAAKAKLLEDPMASVRKFFIGLATFWYQMTTLKNSIIAGTLAILAWALAIVGARRAHREGKPVWLMLTPVLYLNLFLAALLALGRYSVPVLPELLVVAAFGVDSLLSKWEALRA